MRFLKGHTRFVQCVAFSPDGTTLASAGADHTARLWDVAAGREKVGCARHDDWVTSVDFAPDGVLLCTGSHDGRVRLWDASTGKPGPGPRGRQGVVTSVAFAPDGGRVAWGSYNGSVGLWGLGRSAAPALFEPDLGRVFTVQFAPGGATLAAAGTAPGAQVWDVAMGLPGGILQHGDRQGCRSLAYAPDGRTLALALGAGLQLWDLASGRLRAKLCGHTDVVSSVAFSPDGRRLLSGAWDRTVRLFEVGPGGETWPGPCFDWGIGRVLDVAFAPDGMTAAAAGSGHPYLVVWDVD
jgi:WD40 repeat protein